MRPSDLETLSWRKYIPKCLERLDLASYRQIDEDEIFERFHTQRLSKTLLERHELQHDNGADYDIPYHGRQ